MPRSLRLARLPLVLMAALCLPLQGLGAGGVAHATGTQQVLTVAGGPHDLVYAVTSDGGRAEVRVRDDHGKTRTLGSFALSGTDSTRFSLVGSTLVGVVDQAQQLDAHAVRWWDLKHHRAGTITVPSNAFVDGAVRGGVLYEVPSSVDPGNPNTVEIKKLGGKRITLPHAFGSDPDIAYLGAPHGVVAVDYDRATAATRYARYGHRFRNLASGGAVTSTDRFTCYAATASLVTCAKRGSGTSTTGYGLPLDGSKAVAVSGVEPVAVGSTLVYGKGGLVFRTSDGKARLSNAHGTPVGSAFGDVVLENGARTTIRVLSGPHAAPKLLVRAG